MPETLARAILARLDEIATEMREANRLTRLIARNGGTLPDTPRRVASL
jgi:hypothetical protein